MASIPFRQSDYVTEVVSQFDPTYQGLSNRLTTPQVSERAKTFEQNVHRAILLAQLPEFIARETRQLTQILDTAVQIIIVPPELSIGSPEYMDFVNARLPEALLKVQAEFTRVATPETTKAQVRSAESTLLHIFDPDSGHPSLVALQALYISLVVNIWTAFEAMAGDLWETAVNSHPRILADLNGKEGRIGQKAGYAGPTLTEDKNKVSNYEFALAHVHHVTNGDYDLKHKMGTLLKRRFRFTVLKEIRFAYSRAFSYKHDLIDDVLSRA